MMGVATRGVAAVSFALGFGVIGYCTVAPPAVAENPACTTSMCSFRSPSGNIECEINFQRDPGLPDETYCQTGTPPRSVHMSDAGVLTNCTGISCLGNAAPGTATLDYGQAAGIGPFHCLSQSSGVTCTVPSGRGFAISREAITPVG
jgi:hypothetical protein